jgi:hypothetical protein
MGGLTDIELDPWSGLIVDSGSRTPVDFRNLGE